MPPRVGHQRRLARDALARRRRRADEGRVDREAPRRKHSPADDERVDRMIAAGVDIDTDGI
jgi:hypothetical protein